MVRTRTRKRAVTKSGINAEESLDPNMGQFSINMRNQQKSISDSQPVNDEWTPIQKEQIKLANQLDDYISEFQRKVLRLNFVPSDRELIVLFIMNLHPRWRRMVEHVELSFSSWVEAAAFARLHCARVSAIMGCEDTSSPNAIFKTPESRALRDSGYFVPDTCASAAQKKDSIDSIKHLLISEEKQQQINRIFAEIPVDSSSLSPKEQQNDINKTNKAVSTSKDSKEKEAKNSSKTQEDKWTFIRSISPNDATSGNSSTVPDGSLLSEASTSTSTATASAAATVPILNPTVSPSSSTSSITPRATPTKAQIAQNREKNNNKKKNTLTIPIPVVDLVENSRILTHVPSEHSGVNLTFLELPVNGKTVKGLLAKMRWGSSAISLDCVKRLGLPMRNSDNFCINTDFGYVDSIGILTLPIYHPADPVNVASHMEIQVLPSIYGGKLELVLGADFFHFYNPTLNIKSRSIQFLGKETPYIVEKLK